MRIFRQILWRFMAKLLRGVSNNVSAAGKPLCINLHSYLIVVWDWSQKLDLLSSLAKCNRLTIGREVPLTLSFSPDGSGTTIPVSKSVKDLGAQIDNVVFPSTQCNEAERLIFMIRCSFQDLSRSAFIQLYEALVRPHLECGMPAWQISTM